MNESATIECPWCQQSLTIPPEAFGQPVSCPVCSGKFVAESPPAYRAASQFRPAGQRNVAGGVGRSPGRNELAAVLWVLGIGGLLGSGLLGYWWLYEPLEEMRRHVPQVSYSGKIIMIFPFFAVCSLAVTVAAAVVSLSKKTPPPVRAPRPVQDNDLSIGGKFLCALGSVVVLAPGFWLHSWFNDQVEKLGYKNGFLTVPRPRDSLPDPELDGSREFDRIMMRKYDQDFSEKLRGMEVKEQ